ncbi:MAG TPA: formyltransferase family protein [Pirellulales bacterium]|jgi:folate-dependent phosphoribosylglycinamide formyltransferase PurN
MMDQEIRSLRTAWDKWTGIDPLPDLSAAARQLAQADFPAPPAPRTSGDEYRRVKPALKSLTLPLLSELRSALRRGEVKHEIAAWAQTLLTVCEVRKTTIRERLAEGGLSAEQTQQKLFLLVLFFLEYFQKSQDGRYVNVAIKLLEQPWALSASAAMKMLGQQQVPATALLSLSARVATEHGFAEISSDAYHTSICLNRPECNAEHSAAPRQLSKPGKHVVIFCPNRYGLYTLAVTQQLLDAGVKIDAILVRKLLNPMRLVTEFRRDGVRLLKKAWRKLVLRKHAYSPKEYETLPDLLARLKVTETTVDALAAKNGIPAVYCASLNDLVVHQTLDQYRPDLVVFAGGGIVGPETLARAGAGVVNCHMGKLPQYRGMDVVEWPLIENHQDDIGFTVHFMAKGIDTGDILGIFSVDNSQAATVYEYREKFEKLMAVALVDTVVAALNSDLERRSQGLEDGKQYFIVHPRLYQMLRDRYVRNLKRG